MADDQQFCLRWNNHQSTLISVFDTLLENGTLVDCTLAAEGQSLKAHKVVLSACSPYLETLLSEHYEKHPIIIMKDVKFTELKSMMDYMYRGEVNICQDQLGTFLKAAESLQIKGLSENGEGDARDVGSTTTRPPPPKRPPATPAARTDPEQPPAASPAHRPRDGSISPSSRKRRRTRRNSDDANHFDSNSCDLPLTPAQSTPVVPNIPASITSTPIRTPVVKPEINDRLDHNSLPPESGLLKEKIEPAEQLLEPKTEYLEDLNNDDSVEDLTLDDDDEMDMSQMSNMSNMSRPGPSHGTDISNQGFSPWQLGNQSGGNDEVFMAAQEAVNSHRDSQEEPEKSAANDNPVPILQVINVDTNKPLKIIKIDTTLYKKKLAARKQEALQKTQEKPDEPLKWLQSQFVEVEVCSTETPTCIPEEALSAEEQEEPSNQDDDYMDDNESAECYEGSSAVESDEEEEWEGKSPNIILSLNTKGKRGSFENVTDDMEFDEESQRFICKRCKKTFKVKASVLNHLRNICTKDPRFGCEYCPYKARSGVSLRVHYGRYHNTTKTRVKTNTIPSYRASKHSLPMVKAEKSSALTPKRPKAKGNKEIPSVKVLRKKPEKRRKVKKVQTSEVKKKEESGDIGEKEFGYDKDSKTYTCKTCGERFKSEQAVGVHTNVICRQVSRKGFKCYFCPYTGRNSALLRVHMGKKHGKWPKLDENGVWLY